jgi:outer membrane protein assembly factor BamB
VHNAPAVSAAGVYATPIQVVAIGIADGASAWEYQYNEQSTPVLCGGELFLRNAPQRPVLVLDAATGAELANSDADAIAAFSGTQGFFLVNGALRARDIGSLADQWTFTGDASLVMPPIVVGSTVYVGSSAGTLFAVDAGTGQQIWSDAVGAPMTAPDDTGTVAKMKPLTGLAEANGVLVVPAGSLLVAYAP